MNIMTVMKNSATGSIETVQLYTWRNYHCFELIV